MTTSTSTPTLRQYQLRTIEKIQQAHGRQILALDMGLGKSATAIKALEALPPNGNPRILIVAPKVAIGVWQRELATWAPHLSITTITASQSAAKRVTLLLEYQSGVLMVNPAMLKVLITNNMIDFDVVIIDEAHQLRNRQTIYAKQAKRLRADWLLLLTGSPLVNGPADIWMLLHLLHPKTYTSFWSFCKKFLHVTPNIWGGYDIDSIKDPAALQRELAPHITRIKKYEVLTDLPEKTRQLVPVTLHPKQRKIYDELADDMLTQLPTGKFLITPIVVSQITRLRQVCVTPALIDAMPESALLDAMAEAAQLEFDAERHIAIFTPFAEAIFHIIHALPLHVETYIIRGGMSEEEIAYTVSAFQTKRLEPIPKVLICSLAMATSFTATEASTAFFVGFGWHPTANIQAEDRLHRIGQTRPVLIKYFVGADTIEEHIVDVLDGKTTWERQALDPSTLLRPVQKRGAFARG